MSLPPTNKLEAIEGLLMLSKAYVSPEQKESLDLALNEQAHHDFKAMVAKKKTIWDQWEPDIKGWRKMMTKYLEQPLMYRKLRMHLMKARRLLKDELRHAEDPSYEVIYTDWDTVNFNLTKNIPPQSTKSSLPPQQRLK